MTTEIAFVSDPGRCWLKVSHAAIHDAGSVDDISSMSGIDRTHAYLEEHRDAPRFIAALQLDAQAIATLPGSTSPILALPPYTPAGLAHAANGVPCRITKQPLTGQRHRGHSLRFSRKSR